MEQRERPDSPSHSYRNQLAQQLKAWRAQGQGRRAHTTLAQERETLRFTLAQALVKEQKQPERVRWDLDEAVEQNTYNRTISNELSLYRLFPYLKDTSGVGIGVGFDQMLDIAANSNLTQVFIVDLSAPTSLPTKAVLEIGHRFHELTGRYPTPPELVAHVSRRQLPMTFEMLQHSFTPEELTVLQHALSKDYMGFAPSSAVLRQNEPTLIEEYLTYKMTQPEYASWISTPENLEKIISFYEQNRIIPVQANLAGTTAMRDIATHLRHTGQSLSLVYLSNVMDHLLFYGRADDPQRMYENLRMMPIHKGTRIIETRVNTLEDKEEAAPLPPSLAQAARLKAASTERWSYLLYTFGDRLKEQAGAYQSLNLAGRASMAARYPSQAQRMGLTIPTPGIVIAGLNEPQEAV